MAVALRRGTTRTVVVLALSATAVLVAAAAVVQRAAGGDRLTPLGAVVLGLVEGVTEYLPISSTGHLLVAGRLMGLGGSEAQDRALDTYAICIQAGAIAAVVVLYWRRLQQLGAGLLGRDDDGRRILFALLAAFVPTVAIAVILGGVVRDHLYGPGPIAAAWIAGGVVILLAPRFGRAGAVPLSAITVGQAAVIGLAQALALWPGTSRSLVTILAATAVGLSLAAAVEFSFLLGLATLGAATAFEALQNGEDVVARFGVVTPLLGLVVAFAAAVVAVRWMVAYLESRGLELFGWYRLAIGGGTLLAMTAGVL